MRSLLVRLPLLATAALAVALAASTVVVFEVLLVSGRSDLESAIEREQRRVATSVIDALPIRAQDVDVRAAVNGYLRRNPGNESYATLVRVGDELLRAESAPVEVLRLQAGGELPSSLPGEVVGLDTAEGEILSFVAPLVVEGREVATVQVLGPLEPVRHDAFRTLRRLGVAAGASLVLGGGLVALALRRALGPLRQLAATARSTELESLSARVPGPDRRDEVGDLAREFNRMLDRLERAAASRQEFLATISHELRTPLTIARGHLEVLEAADGVDPARVRRATVVVLEELARMGRLVDDLMALARSEAEDFVVLGPLDLGEFFDDLRLRVAGLGLTDVRVVDPPDAMLAADGDRLAQALLNLVVNAAVHTPPGTPVEVAATVGEGWVDLVVRDEGPGIEPDIRDRAFEPFVHGRTPGRPTSTGLGLAVVAAISAAHDGQVAMRSGPTGTTVTLRLAAPGSARAT